MTALYSWEKGEFNFCVRDSSPRDHEAGNKVEALWMGDDESKSHCTSKTGKLNESRIDKLNETSSPQSVLV